MGEHGAVSLPSARLSFCCTPSILGRRLNNDGASRAQLPRLLCASTLVVQCCRSAICITRVTAPWQARDLLWPDVAGDASDPKYAFACMKLLSAHHITMRMPMEQEQEQAL